MLVNVAATRAAIRNGSVNNSYVEISRFIRTQSHGTSLTPRWNSRYTRSFTSCSRKQLEINDSLRGILQNYKKTLETKTKSRSAESPPEVRDIYGYLGPRRDISKKLSFIVVRGPDQRTCMQVISSDGALEGKDEDAHSMLKSLREWTPVHIRGVLKDRKPPKDPKVLGMNMIADKELELLSIEALNDFPTDLIIQEGTVYPPELRHLDIRTNRDVRETLMFRSAAVQSCRDILHSMGFMEVETPMLFKSTPEGAREFIVPTRTKGLAYALPQSPQQYKQILMASGIPKYYQVARCFRDEDLRADRQPEFTQLDMEVAFVDEVEVMNYTEALIRQLFQASLDVELPEFERMTYHDAMAKYGSDKPDLRFGMEIHNVTSIVPKDLVSKISPLENPIVEGIKLSADLSPKEMREFVSKFLDSPEAKPYQENPDGAPGIFICDPSRPMSGLDALGFETAEKLPQELQLEAGDLLVLQARKNEPFYGGSTMLGQLRLALRKAAAQEVLMDELDPQDFKMLWVVDFPLFSPSNDTDPGQGGSAGLSSTHHPFTAPKTPEDVDMLLGAPEKVIAAHYDIVCNGVELGGGSCRIHNAEVQEFVLRDVLKMSEGRIEDFRHLLEVLRSGCPPHAGIALGLDRLIAVMRGYDSVRNVIAFPKNGKGEDALVKSPNPLTKEQLETYHLKLRD